MYHCQCISGILEEILKRIIETTFEKLESGFRRRHLMQDNIFILRRIAEKLLKPYRDLYIYFINFEMVFDKATTYLKNFKVKEIEAK